MKLHPLYSSSFNPKQYTHSFYLRKIYQAANDYSTAIESFIDTFPSFNIATSEIINHEKLLKEWLLIEKSYGNNLKFINDVFSLLETYWYVGDLVIPSLKHQILSLSDGN